MSISLPKKSAGIVAKLQLNVFATYKLQINVLIQVNKVEICKLLVSVMSFITLKVKAKIAYSYFDAKIILKLLIE